VFVVVAVVAVTVELRRLVFGFVVIRPVNVIVDSFTVVILVVEMAKDDVVFFKLFSWETVVDVLGRVNRTDGTITTVATAMQRSKARRPFRRRVNILK
jgi:hypothetical protein